jgi:hypothetical protein
MKPLIILAFIQSAITAVSLSEETDIPNLDYSFQSFYQEEPLSTIEQSKNGAKATTQQGNVQVTVEIENIDFASQCKAEWEKHQESKNSKKNRKDKKENHSPKAEITFSWNNKK